MSIVELNLAGDKLVCAGQNIIENYINDFNNKDFIKYELLKDGAYKKKWGNIDVRNIIKPNYWNENLKHILAMENMLLSEEFINDVLKDEKHLWNTSNTTLNNVNLYNIKSYANEKLYNLYKK
tara:strand:- start:1048 stop:1416 length:369 start_codon:yes stop_codon:yes gene_type:complete